MTRVQPGPTVRRQAQLIRDALIERGISQVEFCRMVDITPKHLNEVLRGRAGAYSATLDDWAAALGCEWRVQLVRLRKKGKA